MGGGTRRFFMFVSLNKHVLCDSCLSVCVHKHTHAKNSFGSEYTLTPPGPPSHTLSPPRTQAPTPSAPLGPPPTHRPTGSHTLSPLAHRVPQRPTASHSIRDGAKQAHTGREVISRTRGFILRNVQKREWSEQAHMTTHSCAFWKRLQ